MSMTIDKPHSVAFVATPEMEDLALTVAQCSSTMLDTITQMQGTSLRVERDVVRSLEHHHDHRRLLYGARLKACGPAADATQAYRAAADALLDKARIANAAMFTESSDPMSFVDGTDKKTAFLDALNDYVRGIAAKHGIPEDTNYYIPPRMHAR